MSIYRPKEETVANVSNLLKTDVEGDERFDKETNLIDMSIQKGVN